MVSAVVGSLASMSSLVRPVSSRNAASVFSGEVSASFQSFCLFFSEPVS